MDLFERAMQVMEQGAYPQALKLWNQIEATELEEQAWVGFQTARCLQALHQLGLAFEEAERALELVALSSDLGQQLIGLLVSLSRLRGDLGRARYFAEAATEALVDCADDCSLETLVKMAEQRAELARELGQPDDAEETLAEILDLLEQALSQQQADSELSLGKAKILEARAHNRWLGHASVLAEFDLEDAHSIYSTHLGSAARPTQYTRNLLNELRACA